MQTHLGGTFFSAIALINFPLNYPSSKWNDRIILENRFLVFYPHLPYGATFFQIKKGYREHLKQYLKFSKKKSKIIKKEYFV